MEIYLALSVRGICQQPLFRSKVFIIFEFPTPSNNSLINGRGKESMTVILFIFLKSVQKRYVPCAFGTRMQGVPKVKHFLPLIHSPVDTEFSFPLYSFYRN